MTTQPSTSESFTLYITSHDDAGKARIERKVLNDVKLATDQGYVVSNLYTTSSSPADMNDDADLKQNDALLASGKLAIVNPNGTVFRLTYFAPQSVTMMHRTLSLDMGYVIEGSIIMILDDGTETTLNPGDVIIQRGTIHSWKNPSDTQWTKTVFFLQHSKPVEIGGRLLEEEWTPVEK